MPSAEVFIRRARGSPENQDRRDEDAFANDYSPTHRASDMCARIFWSGWGCCGVRPPRVADWSRAVSPENRERAWLVLAMSSTFAGNLTVLGSVANLIVVEQARREGVTISFWEYCKVGIPLTVLTLVVGIVWLRLVQY